MKDNRPVEFSWEICYTCNYRCPYCGRWNDASSSDLKLGTEEWTGIWNKVHERYGPCNMYLSGAEPSTYPGFFDIAQKISAMHTITVCTNFSWKAEEILDRDIDPARFQVTPTFHSLFADFDSFLDKAVRLKDWIRNKMVFFVAYNMQMEKVEYYKARINGAGLNFSVVPLRANNEEGKIEVISTTEEKSRISEITDMHKDDFEYLAQNKSPRGKLCNAGHRYAIIKPTGKVFSCSQGEISLGNIHDGSFALSEGPAVCAADCCPYESYNLIERQA
ncbi:MAG: hypothetical protein WC312_02820 [Candidatus Omnitrophota bacterium]|jgi:MoaA/NifB/PqqE/SkfB family radical SAM enzyme